MKQASDEKQAPLVIRERYPQMTQTEKRIADCVLDNPQEAINETVVHLARRAGVSVGSVTNFAASMGYQGFTDMKVRIAQSLGGKREFFFDDVSADDRPKQALRKLIHNASESFQATLDGLQDELDRAMALLLDARCIGIFACGSSLPIAYAAHYRFMRLGLPVVFVADPLLASVSASQFSAQDVAFAISYQGRTVNTLTSVRKAKQNGARVIGLTGFADSPLAALSDVCLVSVSGEASEYREAVIARLTQDLLVDSLCTCIAARRGPEAMRMLDREIDVINQYRDEEV